MPKLKPISMFAKRNLVILILGEYVKDGILNSSSIIVPLTDEFHALGVKSDFHIVHHTQLTGEEVSGRPIVDSCGLFSLINSILNAQSPTIIEALDFDKFKNEKVSEMLISYIKMLVMSTGGIIIRLVKKTDSEKILEDGPLPIINYDIMRDSWTDVQTKIGLLAQKMLSKETINYFSMIQSFSSMGSNSCGTMHLGDISRCFVDVNSDSGKLKSLIMLSGAPNNPISLMEFSQRIWCNPDIPSEDFSAEDSVILRDSGPCSKIISGKLLSDQDMLAKDFKIIKV